MKLSFSTLGCPDWPLEKVVKAAVEYGFDGVELRGIGGTLDIRCLPEFAPENLSRTRSLFKDAGIEIVSVDSSASFSHTDEGKLQSAMQEARDYIALAKGLGVPFVRVFGGYVPPEVPFDDGLQQLADCLRELGESALHAGVVVALETHDSFLTGEVVSKVMKRVNNDSVGVVWDVSNCFWTGEPLEKSAKLLAPYVRLVHIKDSVFEDSEAKLVFIGEGGVPVKKALELLANIGYDGYLSYEWEKVWQPALPKPEEAFPQYVSKMNEYLAELR